MEGFVREKRSGSTPSSPRRTRCATRPGKQFVSGEGFPYLGRSYRLLLVDAQDVPLKLEARALQDAPLDVAPGARQMVRWYTDPRGNLAAKRRRASSIASASSPRG
jgi:hypothetical protein